MVKKRESKTYNLHDINGSTKNAEQKARDAENMSPVETTPPSDIVIAEREFALANPLFGLQEPKGYSFATALKFEKNETLVVDVETTGLGRFDRIVGVGIMGLTSGLGTYIPYNHKIGPNLKREEAISYLQKVLSTSSNKVLFNQKFDIGMLAKDGIITGGETHDPIIMAALLNENRLSYELKRLAHEDLGVPPTEKNILKDWLTRNGFKSSMVWEAPSELVGVYCFGDLTRTAGLYNKYKDEVYAQENLNKVYNTERRFAPILLLSEMHGIRLDVETLEADQKNLSFKVAELNQKAQALADSSMFNPDSNVHLSVLFDKWGIPYTRTEKGNPCFDADALESLKQVIQDHASISAEIKTSAISMTDTVLELRCTANLLNFVQGFIKYNQNGRLYPNWNALRGEKGGAVTGRMSSDSPNLQNIPKEARKYFIPDEGYVWVAPDYSQIEYRIFAHYSNDKKILEEYKKNPWTDYHQMVADMMGISRKPAKSINFGLLYAMGKGTLAEQLGMTVMQADPLFIKYHTKFPCVRKLRKDVTNIMEKRGYIRNLFGRCRHITGRDTYKALNSLIQGSAADLLKYAANRVYTEVCYEMEIIPLLYIHDEIVFQLKESQVDEFLRRAVPIMQDFPQLNVPIRVDVAMFRKNWATEIPIKLKWNGQ